jgi:hypothetical protein
MRNGRRFVGAGKEFAEVLGWILIPYIMVISVFVGRRSTGKQVSLQSVSWAGVALVLTVFSLEWHFLLSPQSASAAVSVPEKSKSEQLKEVNQFWNSLETQDETSIKASDATAAAMSGVVKGTVSMSDFYASLAKAKFTAQAAMERTNAVPVPKEVFDSKSLAAGQKDLGDALNCRVHYYDDLQRYFDTDSVFYLSKAKGEMSKANDYTLSGTSKIYFVRISLEK